MVADAHGRGEYQLRAKSDSTDMDSLNVRETGAPGVRIFLARLRSRSL